MKTLWEKEKMLFTSIVSFSHNEFSKCFPYSVVKSHDCVDKGKGCSEF